MNKNTRIIYDDDFYRLGVILLSEKYKVFEGEFRNLYQGKGLPIPQEGFRDDSEYREWLKKAMKLKNKNDLPGIVIQNLLNQLKLDPKNERYREGIASKIFFNRQYKQQPHYAQRPINLVWKNKDDPNRISVYLYPWTKRTDYIELWKTIKKIQKLYPGYRGKEKFQTTFERDLDVYKLYLKVKNDIKTKNEKIKYKSIIDNMPFYDEYKPLVKRFKDDDLAESLRSITSRFNLLLQGTSIL